MAMSIPGERRLSHRYDIQLPIELVLTDGTVLPADACHISSQGIQFKCDSWLADEIEPKGIQNYTLHQVRLKVVATLSLPENKRLYARCRVDAARRLSQDDYLIGLKFIDFENGSEKTLDQYINDLCKHYQGDCS